MHKFVCEKNSCTGCRACADSCARNAIRIEDHPERIYAVIDEAKCVDCGLCRAVCPNHHPVKTMESIAWNQGWCVSDEGRQKSSSGGAAAALAEAVIREEGLAAGCLFSEGQFAFKLAETMEELEAFRGSKYVKSNPEGIYKAVQQKLKQGRTVLFTGLPCQVAGLKNFVGPKLAENLVTVDLICHGTPSPVMLSSFLKQHGKDLGSVSKIKFRRGVDFRLYIDGAAIVHPRVQDLYTLSFLKSINYTENCYRCPYAKPDRAGDITLGDSWGSGLPETEQRKGVSLILCQSEKGMEWVRKAALHLEPVDMEEARKHNHQLNHPSAKPEKRAAFLKAVQSGGNYAWAVARAYPKECAKLAAKAVIVKTMDVLKPKRNNSQIVR